MRKQIQIFLGILLMMFFGLTAIHSQETTEKPKENIANSSRTIQLAEIDECAKLLEKSVEANKAATALIANLETEISERKKLQSMTDEEIKALRQTIDSLKSVIAEQQKLIEILTKQSKTKIKVCLIC